MVKPHTSYLFHATNQTADQVAISTAGTELLTVPHDLLTHDTPWVTYLAGNNNTEIAPSLFIHQNVWDNQRINALNT